MAPQADSAFRRPRRGLILGKFMPPHLGHQLLADFAATYCDELTILVCSIAREPIPGRLRWEWMRQLYPRCNVVHVPDEVPQAPEDHPDFWPIWRDLIARYEPRGYDVFFSSEPYGGRVAAETEARHVPVDIARETVPVSGAQIRADPMRYWDYIPRIVRPYYLRRVCVFGPESTGKSTIARQLAAYYDTAFVPEYARSLLDPKGGMCAPEDIPLIARGQAAAEDAIALNARRVLFCDTDVVLTQIWSEMLFGYCPDWIVALGAARRYNLTLLMDVDVPWMDDSQRYLPDPAERREFFDRCQKELDHRGDAYVRISGDWNGRFQTACRAVDGLLTS
jgi:NadR type nicotinamide-nucleotide adenylyltransferase